MGFETFTKGMQDANEVLNRNFAAVETQLSSKAGAEPPQKFELPLAEGWTKYQQPYYQRNAFGEVTIWG